MRYCLLLLAIMGCDSFTAPDGAYRIEPPASFADDWRRMEDCSGIHGDMRRITWYAVPSHFPAQGTDKAAGMWVRPHTIYLVEGALGSPSLVAQHEMLHDLLQTGEHPAMFDKCRVR